MTWAGFFRNEILGMLWIKRAVERALTAMGIDIMGKFGAILLFFIYDILKISILLCVLIFIMSFVESYFPPQRTRKMLGGKRGIGASLMAAILGILTPFCSCSSIPVFIGFVSAGLPLNVTFSFLISSPMVDLASLMLIASIWGVKIAVLYAITGVFIAVIGGTVIGRMNMEDEIEDFVRSAKAALAEDGRLKLLDRLEYALDQVKRIVRKVFLYILLGVGTGALIHNCIPEAIVERVLGGGNPFAVILAVAAGVPIYSDIFGTIPVAEALILKGAYPGVVIAFMMAVTTLSIPSLVMLSKVCKKKLLTRFVIICILGIIVVGYVFNILSLIHYI